MPEQNERRIIEMAEGLGFIVTEWRKDCPCPSCKADGHWYVVGEVKTRAEAELLERQSLSTPPLVPDEIAIKSAFQD